MGGGTVVAESLEGKNVRCPLGEQTRRAPPRPDPPVVCPGFGLDKFFSFVFAGDASHEIPDMLYMRKVYRDKIGSRRYGGWGRFAGARGGFVGRPRENMVGVNMVLA